MFLLALSVHGALEILHQEAVVVFEDGTIVLLLHRGQLHVDDGLGLGWDILCYVFLHTAQQVGRDTALQTQHLLLRGDGAVLCDLFVLFTGFSNA